MMTIKELKHKLNACKTVRSADIADSFEELLLEFSDERDGITLEELELFDEFCPGFSKFYLSSGWTYLDVLRHEYTERTKEWSECVRKCESSGMLFVRINPYGTSYKDFMPLCVNLPSKKQTAHQCMKLFKKLDDENNQYQLFKMVLFSQLAIRHDCGYSHVSGNAYINQTDWVKVLRMQPEFAERLQTEGKAYYKSRGYFTAKKKLTDESFAYQKKVESLGDAEKTKIYQIRVRGRAIRIFGT